MIFCWDTAEIYSFCHINCVLNRLKWHYFTSTWDCFYNGKSGCVLAWNRTTGWWKGTPDLNLPAEHCSGHYLEQPFSKAFYLHMRARLLRCWWKRIRMQSQENYTQITRRVSHRYVSFSVLSAHLCLLWAVLCSLSPLRKACVYFAGVSRWMALRWAAVFWISFQPQWFCKSVCANIGHSPFKEGNAFLPASCFFHVPVL